jgi:GNAT superfamily N-acetyltransferase
LADLRSGITGHHNDLDVIRDATEADIPRLVEMGVRFLTETVYAARGVPVNMGALARTMALLILGDRGTVFVAERDGRVVGGIGMLWFENPLSGEPSASELFWYIEPEHRGIGVRLLKRGEQWARDMGAEKLHMIAPTPAVSQLYERLGYAYLETTYQKALA